MPDLQRFFVAWEADALPTELFPLNDLRGLGLRGVHIVSTRRIATEYNIDGLDERFEVGSRTL